MGRSYWFECSRCGYRTVASGKPDRGHDFFVETIACLDCRKLYDAVVKLRVPVQERQGTKGVTGMLQKPGRFASPPTFEAALTRLPVAGVRKHRWKIYKPVCPVSESHRVQQWRDPGACPRCGLALEKNPLPFRIWE